MKTRVIKPLILGLIMLLSFNSIGQDNKVYGYQGKKNTLSIDNNLNISGYMDFIHSNGNIKLYDHISLNYETVIRNKFSFGFFYIFKRLRYSPDTLGLVYSDGISDLIHEYDYFTEDKANINTLALNFYLYGRNYVAPMGKYHRFSIAASIYNIESFYDNENLPNAFTLMPTKGWVFTVLYKYGRKLVLSKNLFIDYGVDFGIGLNRMAFKYSFANPFPTDRFYDQSIPNFVKYYINENFVFGFDIGIGYIF